MRGLLFPKLSEVSVLPDVIKLGSCNLSYLILYGTKATFF